MFKYFYSKLLIGLIVITCFCNSCINKNAYTDLKDQERIEALYGSIIKPYLTKLDYVNSLRIVDSIYAKETHSSFWADHLYYNSKSWINNHLKNHQLAINYADTLINIIEKKKLQDKVSDVYTGLYIEKGNGYLGLHHYTKAYEYYFKAKQLAEKYNDNCVRVNIVKSIAIVLYNQQQFEDAKRSYFEVLTYMRKCSYLNENNEQQTIDDIALCYTKLNQYDSANYYYRVALKNIEKYRYTSLKDSISCMIWYASSRGVVLGNLAKIYLAKNELDSAIKLYKEAIYLNTNIGSEKTDAQLCEEQFARIQFKKNDLVAAKKSLDDLRKGLDTLPNSEAKLGWLEMMAIYYQSTNNPPQEIKYYKEFIAFRDSLNLAKKGLQETTINKELKDKEQQFEITVLQKDNQLSKLYLWVVAIACAMAAIVAFLLYKNFRKGKKNIITLTNLNNQISEQQKKTEFALQQLEISNKDKDRILRVVAHDLRNPISGIAAISQSILENDEDNESKDLIKMIENTSTHSLTLINELLQTNTGKNEVLNIQTIEINNLVKQTAALLIYKAFEKKQKINVSLLPNSLFVNVDEGKMDRVIGNLITNAIKFSPQSSTISVDIVKDETCVIISIKDNGIGISKEMQPNIFEMFGNAKRKGTDGEKSFGLGLSICKQIVEAHKGKIWVESKVNKGSCFYIELPLTQNI